MVETIPIIHDGCWICRRTEKELKDLQEKEQKVLMENAYWQKTMGEENIKLYTSDFALFNFRDKIKEAVEYPQFNLRICGICLSIIEWYALDLHNEWEEAKS